MAYVVHAPVWLMADELLAHDEEIVCRSATIIQKKNGEFAGWLDNQQLITIYVEEEEDAQN